jgi:hypothetical protein
MEITPLHTKADKVIQLTGGMIVLEDPKGFPSNESNLYYVSLEGTILWRAEKPEPQALYSRMRLNENGRTLSTYTLGGHSCELDVQTGRILSQTKIQ